MNQANSATAKEAPQIGGNSPLEIARQQPNLTPEQRAEVERIGTIEPYVALSRDEALFSKLNYWRDLKLCGRIQTKDRLGIAQAFDLYSQANTKRRGGLLQVPAPVVYVEAESPCRGTDMLLLILEFLSNPLNCGPLRDLRKRTLGTLQSYKVKLLIVNNADLLSFTSFNELMRIFEKLKIAIVLVGMPYLDEMLTPTSGKKARFLNIHNTFLRGYTYDSLSLRDTRMVIEIWETMGLKWSQPLNLATDEEIVKTLHKASNGQLRPLYENLRDIAVWRIKHPLAQINHQNITKALNNQYEPM